MKKLKKLICVSIISGLTTFCTPFVNGMKNNFTSENLKSIVKHLDSNNIKTFLLVSKKAQRSAFMKFNAVSNNCVLLDDKFEKNLTNQIIKFEKLCGGNKFNIDSKIKENCDKRVLILLVESLNAIFEKFPNYAVMISRCAPDQFILGIISESDEELFESNKMIPLAYTRDDLSGVYINKSVVNSSLEDIEKQGINAVKSGFHSKLKMNEVVQAGIAHEVGHCFEYCIMRCVNKNEDNIKEDIINKAKDIDPSFNDFVISKYGEANSSEWFAEVFATLMNGQESTVLTQAMGQYLRSYENAILNVSNNN